MGRSDPVGYIWLVLRLGENMFFRETGGRQDWSQAGASNQLRDHRPASLRGITPPPLAGCREPAGQATRDGDAHGCCRMGNVDDPQDRRLVTSRAARHDRGVVVVVHWYDV
jgi:hypothetical protein